MSNHPRHRRLIALIRGVVFVSLCLGLVAGCSRLRGIHVLIDIPHAQDGWDYKTRSEVWLKAQTIFRKVAQENDFTVLHNGSKLAGVRERTSGLALSLELERFQIVAVTSYRGVFGKPPAVFEKVAASFQETFGEAFGSTNVHRIN